MKLTCLIGLHMWKRVPGRCFCVLCGKERP